MKKKELIVEQVIRAEPNIFIIFSEPALRLHAPQFTPELIRQMGPMAAVVQSQINAMVSGPRHTIVMTGEEYAEMPLTVGEKVIITMASERET